MVSPFTKKKEIKNENPKNIYNLIEMLWPPATIFLSSAQHEFKEWNLYYFRMKWRKYPFRIRFMFKTENSRKSRAI